MSRLASLSSKWSFKWQKAGVCDLLHQCLEHVYGLFVCCLFKTRHYVTQADLELMMSLLPQPPKCQVYEHTSLYPPFSLVLWQGGYPRRMQLLGPLGVSGQ